MLYRVLVATTICLMTLGMLGCPDEEGDPTKDAGSPDSTTGDAADDGSVTVPDTTSKTDDGSSSTTCPAPAEKDDWRIVFTYAGRIPQNENEIELWLMSPLGGDKQKITELAGLDQFEPPLSCKYGCLLSDDLRWLAITTGPPNQAGDFSFRIGAFDDKMNFKLIKDLILKDKIDYKFAGDYLYYTQFSAGDEDCEHSCQYDVYSMELDPTAPKPPVHLLTFPPEYDLEQSTYKGHFKAGPSGTELVFLNTTIRSVGVYLWKQGTGLAKLDFICKHGTEGNCQGTGSEYTDVDPVAISPDGSRIVFFTFSDRFQRARVYDATDPTASSSLAVLASVPFGNYIEHACDFGALEDWQWQRVVGDPVFTPDGTEIVFLSETSCPLGGTGDPPKKPRRDLIRVGLATLETGKTLKQSDLCNVTKNPLGDITDNILITGFRLSPDSATAVFAGTPQLDQNDEFLPDGSSRPRNDREIWRVRLDGTNLTQITNDVAWQARSPKIVPP